MEGNLFNSILSPGQLCCHGNRYINVCIRELSYLCILLDPYSFLFILRACVQQGCVCSVSSCM